MSYQIYYLDYGVTNSHYNARLTSITQNRDCRDIFKLTITLFDSNEQVHLFEHEVEKSNRDYTYNQVIQPNDYQSLTVTFTRPSNNVLSSIII